MKEDQSRMRKTSKMSFTNKGDNITQAAAEIGHIPPQARDIEEAVLGAMMIESRCIPEVMESLSPKSFYDPQLRLIFEAIASLVMEREPADILSVQERLRKNGSLEMVGGVQRLADLTQKIGSAAHIEYYVKILQQKTIQRNLIDASYGILKESFDDSVNVDHLIETSQQKIFDIVQSNIKSDYKHIGDAVNRSLERIQRIQNTEGLTGVPSGYASIDAYTMGWQECNLIILGARPSVGKTAFALNLARNAAVDFGVPTAFFSLEMSDTELADRLISSESGIESEKIKGRQKMTPEEWVHLENTLTRLVKAPIYIDETPGISITEFTSKAKRLVMEKNVKIIFIDYLQLMHGSSANQYSSREQTVSSISQALKATAKELHIPIIALSQLNRNLMGRQGSNGRPVLSDLRDSGSIEQDADIVLFIHRPGMLGLGDSPEDLNRAEIIFAKNRSGKIGTIEMTFSGDQVKFIDTVNTGLKYESMLNYSSEPQMQNTQQDTPYSPFDEFRNMEFPNR